MGMGISEVRVVSHCYSSLFYINSTEYSDLEAIYGQLYSIGITVSPGGVSRQSAQAQTSGMEYLWHTQYTGKIDT